MRIMQGVFLLSVCLLIVFSACRRNRPDLVDRNEAPDTELWYAPPDSTEYEYLVHLYWRGVDNDGAATRFMWVMKDTLVEGEEAWNPADRLRDYRAGTITTKTDSVFAFSGYRNVGGMGQTKNRQAFHIAAIDDNDVIDPTPAAFEFIATIAELPRIRFSTHINGISKPYYHRTIPGDTVGMFGRFGLSWHGTTKNGRIRAYRYFPISTAIEVPGSDLRYTDLSDTMRTFMNRNPGPGVVPNLKYVYGPLASGVYKFAARCIDDAGAESPVSPASFVNGVAQVVVNYDPDTRIHEVRNFYSIGGTKFERQINFEDGVPDTVSYKSWLTLFYSGWDDRRDSVLCSPIDPDKCLCYQFRYYLSRNTGDFQFSEDSRWLPRDNCHKTDTLAVADSNSVNIGSLEYRFWLRTIDEYGRGDGTPPSIDIVGNFKPTLDSVAIEDHFGKRLNVSIVDTLTWNFFKGEGYPYTCMCDTVDLGSMGSCPDHPCPPGSGSFKNFKTFSFRIGGWGHDHPFEPSGSGVKAWQYTIRDPANKVVLIGESGSGWVNSESVNILNDVVRVRFEYPSRFPGPEDPWGDSVFAHLPTWFNKNLSMLIWGRDTMAKGQEGNFQQIVYLNGQERIINEFAGGNLGRLTGTKSFTFHVRLVR